MSLGSFETRAEAILDLSPRATRFAQIRRVTEALAAPLSAEDCALQSMADASPVKWHLAHTTWFFETFVLEPHAPEYRRFDPSLAKLFNSYYNAIGSIYPRAQRGLLTRPPLERILEYRQHVDAAVQTVLDQGPRVSPALSELIELGMQHEQQHQELILTDVKHLLSQNPLKPAYHHAHPRPGDSQAGKLNWIGFPEGLRKVGYTGPLFSFDNEGPRHRAFLDSFALASRLITNAEYLEFINDDGYSRPELWLSEGWKAVSEHAWRAPFYWEFDQGTWQEFTLAGLQTVQPDQPVSHVSYFEADAYARWAEARLPTEAEWETAASALKIEGNLLECGRYHPACAIFAMPGSLAQIFGDVWEWTQSAYAAYPGYRPASGAIGEYNGKFMCNQMVLRGGSCATPSSHIRASYRNFFPAAARWQFSGIRLARDADKG